MVHWWVLDYIKPNGSLAGQGQLESSLDACNGSKLGFCVGEKHAREVVSVKQCLTGIVFQTYHTGPSIGVFFFLINNFNNF